MAAGSSIIFGALICKFKCNRSVAVTLANDVLINQKELPAEGASAYQHAETSIEEVIKMSENKNKPELDMNEIEKATGGFGSKMETCDHIWEDTGIVDEVPYFVFVVLCQ